MLHMPACAPLARSPGDLSATETAEEWDTSTTILGARQPVVDPRVNPGATSLAAPAQS